MALGPLSAAAIFGFGTEIVKGAISDIAGKAAGAAGKAVEKKVMQSLGGKGTIDDEIAYEELETNLTDEERLILEEFRQMKKASFGTDSKAKKAYMDWDNDFRQSVLKRRVLGSSKTAPKTVKKKDGTVTTTEDSKSTPTNFKPAIDFLKRFAAHMKVERDRYKSKRKKRQAGFIAGEAYLNNYNLPSDRPSALGDKVKEIAAKVPGAVTAAKDKVAAAKDKVAAAIPVVKSAGVAAGTKVGEVVEVGHAAFLEHSSPEKIHERRQARPWHSRGLASFLFD